MAPDRPTRIDDDEQAAALGHESGRLQGRPREGGVDPADQGGEAPCYAHLLDEA